MQFRKPAIALLGLALLQGCQTTDAPRETRKQPPAAYAAGQNTPSNTYVDTGDGVQFDFYSSGDKKFVARNGTVYSMQNGKTTQIDESLTNEVRNFKLRILEALKNYDQSQLDSLQSNYSSGFVNSAMTSILNTEGLEELRGTCPNGLCVNVRLDLKDVLIFRIAYLIRDRADIYRLAQEERRLADEKRRIDREFRGYPGHTIPPEKRYENKQPLNVVTEEEVRQQDLAKQNAAANAQRNEEMRRGIENKARPIMNLGKAVEDQLKRIAPPPKKK